MKKKSLTRARRASGNGPAALQAKIRELRARLAETEARRAEAEETLEAIRSGEVDALVVARPEGDQVFTLQGAETTYRLLVEEMNEGALLLGPEGTILYANARFAELVGLPLDQVIGSSWETLFAAAPPARLAELLRATKDKPVTEELLLQTPGAAPGAAPRPVALSLSPLRQPTLAGFSVVVTDLTERKAAEAALRAANEQLETRVQERTRELQQSERRLRTFFDSDMVGTIYWTMDGRITDANNKFLRMLGYSREDLAVGRLDWARITPPEYRERDEFAMAELRATGVDTPYEKEYLRKDGTRLPIIIGAAMLDERRYEGVAFVLDITARKQAEQELRASESRFRSLFEYSPDAVFLTAPDGRIRAANPAACALFGMTEEELRRVGRAGILESADGALQRGLEERERAGRVERMELRYRRKNGERFIGETSSVILPGGGSRAFVIVRDVTRRKAFEAELERLVADRTARLEEMVRELQHVSYSMVHDMRAPLRAMQGFTNLLEEECAQCADPNKHDYFQRIVKATRRIDQQITDALQYTQAVLQEVALKPVDLEPLLRELLDSYPNLHPERADIRIEGRLPVVLGNESLLTQAFSNLLGNAVKFVAPGVRPRIRIRAEPVRAPAAAGPADTAAVRIWIEDNGIGIPRAMLLRVFDMFARGHGAYEGTGIGLAIVRKVVERMGGKVGVQSEEGQGSRFWVELQTAREL